MSRGGAGRGQGRKSFSEELDVLTKLSDLTDLYYGVVKGLLQSDIKQDRIEGAKLIRGSFERIIPQDINLGAKKLLILDDEDGED